MGSSVWIFETRFAAGQPLTGRLVGAQGGDCLFVHAVEDGQLNVWVVAAGNRRDVSRQMFVWGFWGVRGRSDLQCSRLGWGF